MKTSVSGLLREILPAWVICALLPLPAILLWHSNVQDGGSLGLFFAGCTSVVAYAFRNHVDRPETSWWVRMIATGIALLSAFAIFTLFCLILNGTDDLVTPFVALQSIIPALCVTPYLMAVTRKPIPAVVFTLFLVGCMKFIAGIVTNLVYGWGNGHHEMPWTQPNLMVLAFWAATALLCACCYLLGSRTYRDTAAS